MAVVGVPVSLLLAGVGLVQQCRVSSVVGTQGVSGDRHSTGGG